MRETGLVLLTAMARTWWGPWWPDLLAACWTRWIMDWKAAVATGDGGRGGGHVRLTLFGWRNATDRIL